MAVSNHPGVSRGVSSAQPSQKTFCFSGRRPLEPSFSSSPSKVEIHWQRPRTFPSKSGGKEAGKQAALNEPFKQPVVPKGRFVFRSLGRSQTGRGSRSPGEQRLVPGGEPSRKVPSEGAPRARARASTHAPASGLPTRPPTQAREGRKGRYPKAQKDGLEGGLQEGTAGRGIPRSARGDGEGEPEPRTSCRGSRERLAAFSPTDDKLLTPVPQHS